jgi:uncharacterized phage protein gp47/JayE
MPWERPTLRQLFERISRDFSGRLLDGGALLARSVLSVFSKVWAGAAHEMHGMLAWLFLQVFPDTAETVFLERWAVIWGVFRKTASNAAGEVVFSGLEGALAPSGTILQHQSSGQQYVLLADAEIADGAAGVRVRAMSPGAAGNLPAGSELSLIAPIGGLQPTAVVSDEGITGGADEESDESLRARLLDRLRNPPRGGAKHDYEAWAMEVPGVTRAWCYPLGLGVGTVSLTFVCDDAVDGPIPSPEMVERVREHIEVLRPASVKEWEVFAPEVLPVDVTLSVTPDTAAVRAAVEAELRDLIAREGEPDSVLLRSHLTEAVSVAAGERDSVVYAPAENVEVPPGYFPVIGTIAFVEPGYAGT